MKRRMMVLTLVAVLVAVPAAADTKLGTANPNTAQNWAFTPIGTGQVQIVLSWTRNNARLFMALVCGTSDPMTFGTASGTVNRLAVPSGGRDSGSAVYSRRQFPPGQLRLPGALAARRQPDESRPRAHPRGARGHRSRAGVDPCV